jgi:hypothetical protein
MSYEVSEGCRRMAAALHGVAVAHGVSQVSVAVGPYFSGEAATFALPLDVEWRRLRAFLIDVSECAGSTVDVKLAVDKGDLIVAVVPLTGDAASDFADELEHLTAG